MLTFLTGLFLTCAGCLMYEVVLTRILSVVCWYYLVFVSVSMAMFGMTAGALAVQLRPTDFPNNLIPRRLVQAAFGAAISIPLCLMTMLAVPVELSRTIQSFYGFILLSIVIATPFFFCGVVVCLSLTRVHFPVGRIYFADLAGAAFGCFGAVILLAIVDGPSAMFAISGLVFCSAAAYSMWARIDMTRRCIWLAACMSVLAGLNSATIHGIQPIWSKGAPDLHDNTMIELWNPISRIRAYNIRTEEPQMWGPSPRTPKFKSDGIFIDIDGGASTVMTRYDGDLSKLEFLKYDVTSLAAQLRQGGSAAIIGVGGGRDVMNCVLNGYQRIQGIEVNSSMKDLTTRRLDWFSGFSKIKGLEVHLDEGRSFLTRSREKFDLIQASLVDTFAATAAGAMALSENALYTVDGWRVFYDHLKPRGLITFSRWWSGDGAETARLFAVAWAMLLSEGIKDPADHLALIGTDKVASLIVSNQPLSTGDLTKLRSISDHLAFQRYYFPGQPTAISKLATIASARSVPELANLRKLSADDYSPVYDSSPYFFNTVHLAAVPQLLKVGARFGSLGAILFLFAFMLAAILLVLVTIILPVRKASRSSSGGIRPSLGGMVYFVGIGLGFMLVEMAMIQQLAILLGQPIYSLVVVLGGLILATGVGSQVSDSLKLKSRLRSRLPAIGAALLIVVYWAVVIPAIHLFTPGTLVLRVLACLALVAPCGFLMGFCFPVGMRWLKELKQEGNLPWMWALNGAAGTLGSFLAIMISMDVTISACVLAGAVCYLLAGLSVPSRQAVPETSLVVAANS
jgi:hypothetical protein